ncbi:MAG: PAS domain-containing protein, partial [Bacteroidia bacterium]|nr:PAS domain-containing protein [Bacteroidia bacterium]
SLYWVQSTLTPVLGLDKKPIKYIGVRFEVTQLKAQEEQIRSALELTRSQEEELRQNLEEMEAAQEEMRRVQIELAGQVGALNNAAIVSEADLLGDIIYVNDEFCRISKYSREELMGRNHRIVKSGTQPQEMFDDLWATISSGRVWRGIICNRAKDGSLYWVQSTLTPVLGLDKKPIKYIGVR